MAIIYEQTPGALIATPGRTVNSFESGIIRVDRTYVCATSSAANYRDVLVLGGVAPDNNAYPTLDGLYIHPTPNEVERGDGFTEFRVSSYGRLTTSSPDILSNVRNHNQELFINNTGSIKYSVYEPSGTITLRYDQVLNFESLNLPNDILMPFNLRLFETTSADYTFSSIVELGKPFSANNLFYAELQRASDRLYSIRSSIDSTRNSLIQAYTATFTSPTAPDRVISFWVYLPEVTITSQNVFGAFSEVKFNSIRDNGGYARES